MSRTPPRSVDVARRAGVSRATVSNVLNGQGDRFSAETAEKVRRAAEELGYVPSSAGRALVKGRSDVVMIVFPFATMAGLQDIVDLLSQGLAEHGYNAVVQLAGPVDTDAHRRTRHVTESLRAAGVIDLGGLTTADHEQLRALGTPVVGTAVDADGAGSNLVLGRAQAEHLVARGYRQLAYAFLTDERGHPFDQSRTAATREVCVEHGLADPYLFGVPLDGPGAVSAVSTMIKAVGGPVGVACFNDDVALAVLHGLRAVGVEVPDRAGVVGVGNDPLGQLVSPRLSSVWSDARPLLVSMLEALLREFAQADQGEADPGETDESDSVRIDLAAPQVNQGETT